jgi:4-amino-4-deoxy-L-arabinose transferase-like glycosyltransferase
MTRASGVPFAYRPALFVPLLLALAAAVSAWFAPYREPSTDEGALLTAAARILRGGVFYRDLDAYPFPGAHYLLAGAMRLFGEHLGVARATAAAVWCGAVLALYALALQVVSPRRAALFGLLLLVYKFVAWPAFTQYFYWDVAFAWACASCACFMGRRPGASWRLAAAGICAGLALLSKQNLGIYLAALLAALIVFPRALLGRSTIGSRSRELAALGAGLALPLLACGGYFAAHGLLDEMLASGLLRPFTGYLPTSGVSFLEPLRWWEIGELARAEALNPYFVEPLWRLIAEERIAHAGLRQALALGGDVFSRLVYSSIPLGLGLVVVLRARGRRDGERDARLLALGWLSFAFVLSAFPRADFPHVISIHPPLLLLLFGFAERLEARLGERGRGAFRRAEAAAVALALLAAGTLTLHQHRGYPRHVVLERAELWVDEGSPLESIVRYVSEEVPEGGRLFVFGVEAQYYFLTGRFFPWPFSQLYPGQEGGDQGAEIVSRMLLRPPGLILRGRMDWPGLPEIQDFAGALNQHVNERWQLDRRVFERHPIPGGHAPPYWWNLALLRPCPEPLEDCETFGAYIAADLRRMREAEATR